jgi:hypothetical protein
MRNSAGNSEMKVLETVLQNAESIMIRIYTKFGGKLFEINSKVLKTVLQNAESILVRIYTKFGGKYLK